MSFAVFPDQQALLLNVTDPARVCSVVQTARPFVYEGHELVVVPHRLEEVRVLRNLGLEVPSPIGFHYDWPRDPVVIPSVEPLQKEMSAFLTLHPRCYQLSEIGTTKTITTLWAADYLLGLGVLRRVLVLAPLSSLNPAWSDSIWYNFKHRTHRVLYGSAARRRKLFAEDADFYIINHDALRIITETRKNAKGKLVDAKFLREDIDLVIIDELDEFRNFGTDKFNTLIRALRPTMWVWGLTGTPTAQEPSDAWAQCRLITPQTVPSFYTDFREQTMMKLTEYKWGPRAGANDIVYKAMQPSIRFTRKQIFPNLKELLYVDKDCELSPQQARHYKELADKAKTEIEGGQVTAVNEGVKRMRLVQMACGVVYDKLGEHIEVDCRPRVNLLLETVRQLEGKAIVFAPFEGLLSMLERELTKHWSVALVHGQTPKRQRDEIFASFQDLPDPHIILANPGCMSHSLTLTKAQAVIWYAPVDSNYTYTQANGRITRPGQENVPMAIHLAATSVERRMYKRLKERTSLQGLLLDMVQERVPL